MVLQGSKLSSWASLFVLKVEVNFDSIREAVYKVRKWKKILFFHINWEISGKNEKMKQLNMTFLYLSFFTFSLCVILGPPTIKCQDRITCPWEKVWRQGWHSCQASVWGWLQLKESGRKEGRKDDRLGERKSLWLQCGPRKVWQGRQRVLIVCQGDPCVSEDGPAQNPRTLIIVWEWGPCVYVMMDFECRTWGPWVSYTSCNWRSVGPIYVTESSFL